MNSRRLEACEYFGLMNHEICSLLGVTEQELCEYQTEREYSFREAENLRKVQTQEMQKDINEWLQEPEMVYTRKEYLIEEAREAVKDPENPAFKALRYRIRAFLGTDVSDEQIQRAREYPIEELVQVRAGRAKCLFHDDSNPSMDVRKNFYFCYTCGAKGDVIALAQKKMGITFKEAVKLLVQ